MPLGCDGTRKGERLGCISPGMIAYLATFYRRFSPFILTDPLFPAKKRLMSLQEVHELALTDHVEGIAIEVIRLLQIPDKSMIDAYHLAICIVHQIDYLLTWNCKHLANPEKQKSLIEYGRYKDLHIPVICTPAYFYEEETT